MANELLPNSDIFVNLNFEGCITEHNIDNTPQSSGIYIAFVCNKLVDRNGNYNCSRIAYIGKAEGTNNLRKRINEHFENDHKQWATVCGLSSQETFVYVYAIFNDRRLADVESALIYKNQPIVNTQQKDKYNGKSWLLWIECKGNIGLLKQRITAVRQIQ